MNRKNIKTHLISFLVGVFVTYIYFDMQRPHDLRPRAIERDDQVLSLGDKSNMLSNSFENLVKKAAFGEHQLNVETLEENGFYIVKIKAEHIDRDSLDIKIDGEGLSISGKIEMKTENSYSSSTFARSFSLPPQYDTSKPMIENTNDEIIIRFKRN